MADQKAFDNLNPPRSVTDPNGAPAGRPFPKHMHRHVAEATKTSLIVAWKGDTPIHNEFLEVADQGALDAAVAEGWSDKPQLEPAKKNGKKDDGKKD
jgi:hypothetical protein